MGIKPDPKLVAKYGPKVVTTPQLQAKERFLGTLLGLAAGDALAPGGPSRHTELLLVVLRSVTARGKLELLDVARGYSDWFRRLTPGGGGGAGTGPDEQQKLALENLRAGEPPEQSGALAWEDLGRKSAYNGALAPSVPLALLHADSLEGLPEEVKALTRITHADPRCVAAAHALTTAIALLIKGDTTEEAIARAANSGALADDAARQAVERGAGKGLDDLNVEDDASSALKTVEAAFCALAAAGAPGAPGSPGSPGSVEESLRKLASRGGDAHANAAIAGALLGARHGKNAISAALTHPAKAVPDLLAHAETLWKRVSAG